MSAHKVTVTNCINLGSEFYMETQKHVPVWLEERTGTPLDQLEHCLTHQITGNIKLLYNMLVFL